MRMVVLSTLAKDVEHGYSKVWAVTVEYALIAEKDMLTNGQFH